MRTDPRAQESRAAIAAAAEVIELRELAGRPLSLLRRALRSEAAALYRYDADGAVNPIGGELVEPLAAYNRELWATDPTQQEPHQLPAGPRVVLPVQMVGNEAFLGCPAYESFYRPNRISDLMCVWLTECTHGSPGMTAIVLSRPPHLRPFTRSDVRLAHRMLPAFAAAVRRHERFEPVAHARAAAEAMVDAAVGRPWAVLDTGGRPLWVGRHAERYLERRGGALRLPEEVHDACAGWSERSSGALVNEVVFRARDGSRVRAELCLRRADGAAFVLLAFEALAGDGARPHGLSRAEWRVLDCLAEGMSNREVAARLHISVETVRTHVKRVLYKLGVSSRVQAALWRKDHDRR